MDPYWAFSPGWVAPASSPSLHRRELLMAFVALCWVNIGLFLCSHVVLALGSPARGGSAPDASQQCWVEGSHLPTFLQHFITISYISQPFCNILPPETGIGLLLPWEHIADPHATCWLSGCPDPSLPSCLPAGQALACPDVRVYSSPGAGFGIF